MNPIVFSSASDIDKLENSQWLEKEYDPLGSLSDYHNVNSRQDIGMGNWTCRKSFNNSSQISKVEIFKTVQTVSNFKLS